MKFFQERYIVPAFFILYLILGLFIFKNYGISWDEQIQRQHGLITMDYLNETFGGIFYEGKKMPEYELKTYDFRFHGTVFQNVCFVIESIAGIKDDRGSYLLRHLMVFLLFWSSTIAFYLLLKKRFKSWRHAILGVIFLVCSPRIFAHSFYNPKDIPFLAFFTIAIYLLIRFFEKKSIVNAILLCLITALVINARVLGVLIPALVLGLVIIEWWRTNKRAVYTKNNLKPILLYFIGGSIMTVLIWPFLWSNPVGNFLFVFESLKKFFWDTDTLYYSQVIRSVSLPWHYVPGWILVTTPILYLILMLVGLVMAIRKTILNLFKDVRKVYKTKADKIDIVLLGWFFIPLFAVIVFNSTMYDGWRHMFFIYPPLIAFAILALTEMGKKVKKKFGEIKFEKIRKASLMVIAVSVGFVVYKMISDHPNQNVYFNILPGKGKKLDKRFEQEYWGLSCKEVLDYLVTSDNRSEIKVFTPEWSGKASASMLKPEDRARIKYVDFAEADYFLYHHRFERVKAQFYQQVAPFDQELYSVKSNGVILAGLYAIQKDAVPGQ